ncbi:MAG: hypothetical protein V3S80_05750 [Sulfurimonadaceae bacterium]
MKQDNDWQNISAAELLERSRASKKKVTAKASDIGVRVGLLLLMPYIIWLSKYNDSYVASIHGKVIHLDFDGVMQSFHNLINGANMIVHEAGHGVCYLLACPQFMTALNGTVFQLLLPMIFIYYYYKRENSILAGIGGIWLAQNLIYVSWYMSTSHTPNLYPMFLPGGGIHDFWYLFRELGVYKYDWLISGSVRVVAVMLLLASYMYLLYTSFLQNDSKLSRRPYKGKR